MLSYCKSDSNAHHRKSFDHMRHLPKFIPNIPLMALIATGTPSVKEMLHDLLGRDCITLESSVNRPNIYLKAHELKPGQFVVLSNMVCVMIQDMEDIITMLS